MVPAVDGIIVVVVGSREWVIFKWCLNATLIWDLSRSRMHTMSLDPSSIQLVLALPAA